jgi:hypothetical protein
MESSRRVHISYKVSGEALGIVWKRSHHEWTTFVSALHYHAARVCGVPVWCVHLLWKQNLWDEAQLPMNVYIECIVSNKFPEITNSTDTHNRCCNCWEGCDDVYELRRERSSQVMTLTTWICDQSDEYELRTGNCEMCHPEDLCHLCRVRLPGGRYRCLQCLVEQVQPLEDDDAYQARIEDSLASLSKAQQNRWRILPHNAHHDV